MADASLCYRLLRLVNSALYALPSPVRSIRSALLLVGADEFRKMVTVALAGAAATSRSAAVVQMAVERARFCELLAPSLDVAASRMYLLGLLSVIDVILGVSMSQILATLPLDREVKAALLRKDSPLSVALDFARCHEFGDSQAQASLQRALGMSDDAASTVYIHALQ